MTTTPGTPATPAPADTAAPPTPAPTATVTVTSTASETVTSTASVTATSSETVQVVPSPIKVDTSGWENFAWSELAALLSLVASLVLLFVTWRAFRTNRDMADEAARSAEASLLAAQAAQESSAITAAETRVKIDATPSMNRDEFEPAPVSEEEREATKDYPYLFMPGWEQSEGYRLKEKRQAADKEAEKLFNQTARRHDLSVGLDIERVTGWVHRVALVVYPRTGGHERPEGKPEDFAAEATYWGLRPVGPYSFPLPLAPGSQVRFELENPVMVAPRSAQMFLARNWLVVEYSFGPDTQKRLASADWDSSVWFPGWERPVSGPVFALPDVLTNDVEPGASAVVAAPNGLNDDEPESRSGETVEPAAEPARNVGPVRVLAARVFQRVADRISGKAKPDAERPTTAPTPADGDTEPKPETVAPAPAEPDAQDADLRNGQDRA